MQSETRLHGLIMSAPSPRREPYLPDLVLIVRPEDVVIMDWALSFTPNDIQDLTPRQAAARVNPKIVLSIRVGKGAVSKALPVLLEDMSFTGRMR